MSARRRLLTAPNHPSKNNTTLQIFRTPGFAFTKYDYGTECNVRDAFGHRVAFYESW